MYTNQGMSIKEIGKYFNVSNTPISRVLHANNAVKKADVGRYNAIYQINHNLFDIIDTEDKAWLIGFIASDGHVSKNNSIIFTQSEKQLDALQHVKRIFESDAKIKIKHIRGKHKETIAYSFSITSTYIANRLRMMGLNNQKSNGYDFEKLKSYIPNALMPHFLRGLFDGDGSIKYYKYPYFKKVNVHVGFTHTKDAVDFWWEYFKLGTKIVKETEKIFTAVTANRFKAEEIYHILYDDAHTYLKIKKDTFDEFLLKFHEDETKM